MTDLHMCPSKTFRPVWFIVQQTGLMALPCSLIVIFGTLAAPTGERFVVAIVMSMLCLYLLSRFALTHVTVSDPAIEWADWRKSRSVEWSQVTALSVIRPHPFPPVQIQPFTVLVVHLRDGEQPVIYGSGLLRRPQRDKLVEALACHAHKNGIPNQALGAALTSSLETPCGH